jgi:hypothetical protein
MTKMRIAGGVAGAASIAAAAVLLFGFDRSDRRPFVPLPVAANVAALSGRPTFGTPAAVGRLSADLYAPGTAVHPLGKAGYAWLRSDGSVCTLMSNRAGGCARRFDKPVLLFITGAKDLHGAWSAPHRLTGYVPNSVRSVVIVTSTGKRVPAAINDNGLAVSIPAGTAVAGEQVTLRNGETFFNEDELGLSQ